MGALVRTVAPATDPVTLAEAKLHMRVDDTADDDLITSLITAATHTIEDLTGRRFVSQTWKWILDQFPDSDTLPLPLAPVTSVTSLVTIDRDGDSSTFAASNYIVDASGEPMRIVKKASTAWPAPAASLQEANGIEITFVIGYGGSPLFPEELKLAIKMLVAHFYEHREATIPIKLEHVPLGIRVIIAKFAAWDRYSGSARVHLDQER